ncbi:MAG: hypothetical protein K0U74_04440 [Alphaproteobacteria bacterium]|nr:hypothetical protein [Alphaproteobacteria bacterium]
MTTTKATLEIDLSATDPGHLLISLGEPDHQFVNNPETGKAVLTIIGRTQAQADAALAAYAPPAPTADDVRAEASRRMQALVGARDAGHLEIIVTNATREAIRLLRKGTANWTTAEATRAAELEAIDTAIEAIRAASNAMEASPPTDFADDSYWPANPG